MCEAFQQPFNTRRNLRVVKCVLHPGPALPRTTLRKEFVQQNIQEPGGAAKRYTWAVHWPQGLCSEVMHLPALAAGRAARRASRERLALGELEAGDSAAVLALPGLHPGT